MIRTRMYYKDIKHFIRLSEHTSFLMYHPQLNVFENIALNMYPFFKFEWIG